ncbi:MAG: NTP transferase domain-containing protein [Planctomycetota bacterium]|jgi:bifunctional UDP-N-acetylglucosamine pyrophosphorylase/glucosamine-1-phosphate N-acetyltransferase|nr:NTP transferase domain-containing protein [Planctomycetota bacterium]
MPNLQACVLAAGKGTRMGGERPKVLFEANGKPLLEWVLSALSEAGVDDCVAVVGFGKDQVVAKLPTGVRWVEQSPQLGTGHAVRCARGAFQDQAEDIIVACGDMPLVAAKSYQRLVESRRQSGSDAVILTVAIELESHFGRVVANPSGAVERIVEYKDANPSERGCLVGNTGVYCFRPSLLWPALERISNKNVQGEYYLTDVISVLVGDGRRVTALPSEIPGEELGVNTPQDLELAARALAERA